ncbi:MAG TPA: hypothetical protein VG848_07150 [Acetobacteraceae bacterium]|nr:hypothetical protein [Acetobacteraceae bacterium]
MPIKAGGHGASFFQILDEAFKPIMLISSGIVPVPEEAESFPPTARSRGPFQALARDVFFVSYS